MAAQLNYTYSIPKGVAGGKVDITLVEETVTRMNEEADGVLGFGVAVVCGTQKGNTVKLPVEASTAGDFEGIVLHHANTEQDMKGKVVVKNNASLSILRKGHVWGKLATDVTPVYGEKAYVVVKGAEAGCFTNSATETVDIGAKFGKYTDTGIAVIEL